MIVYKFNLKKKKKKSDLINLILYYAIICKIHVIKNKKIISN